jgi:putative ABC transport system permease protein
MSPLSTIPVAMRALLRNKLRSFLTTLGVIIGVGAVVAMTTIGAGAKQRIEQTFEAMGSNMIIVRPGSDRTGGVRGGAGTGQSLTWDDLEALQSEVRAVRYIAPLLQRQIHVTSGGLNWGTSVQGTTPEYFQLRNWGLVGGQFFTEHEVTRGAKVAVLGRTVAENLFPQGDAIGQLLRLDNVPFVVIGIAGSKGETGMGDQDDVVFVPVTAYRSRLSRDSDQRLNGRIYIGAQTSEATSSVEQQVRSLLRARHNLSPSLDGEDDDFRIQNMEDWKNAQQEGANIMTSLLAGIALVSLIVGGIGIMNIMLVSVTERTREIGLRMAVGAKPRHILTQFMVEAVALSVLGGMLGIGVGIGGAFVLAHRFEWNAVFEPGSAVVALISSGVVGIGFGLYPAYRASRLDPIQALRYV